MLLEILAGEAVPLPSDTGKFTLILPAVFGNCRAASTGQPLTLPVPCTLASHAAGTARGSVLRDGSAALCSHPEA